MMTHEAVIDEFRAAEALLDGHFLLSSGLHSPRYLQCARVLMDPARAERLCVALAQKVRMTITGPIDMVASPAMGGVIIVTTGLSSRECLAGIEAEGGRAIGAACLIDRSGGRAQLGVPLVALAELDIPTYPADQLPAALAAIPVVKPGSRKLK